MHRWPESAATLVAREALEAASEGRLEEATEAFLAARRGAKTQEDLLHVIATQALAYSVAGDWKRADICYGTLAHMQPEHHHLVSAAQSALRAGRPRRAARFLAAAEVARREMVEVWISLEHQLRSQLESQRDSRRGRSRRR